MLVKAGHTLMHTHREHGCYWLLTEVCPPYPCLTSLAYFSAHFSISSQNPCPETTAGFLSTMTFWWFTRWVHNALCHYTHHP